MKPYTLQLLMGLISYKPINQTWRILSDQGIKPDCPPDLAKNIRIINQSSFVSFLLIILSSVYLNDIGLEKGLPQASLLFSLLFLAGILCNSLNCHRLAQVLPFLVGTLMIFWGSYTFGYNSQVHFIFICITFGIILNFGQGSWKLFLLAVLVCSLLAAFLLVSGFSFRPPQLSPELQRKISYMSFASCIVVTIILSFIYIRNQNRLIYELQATQKHLEQKKTELEKRNLELDRFVYRISHDLRAPIASSLGLVHLSKQETNRQLISNYLTLQETSLQKLDNFITELLEYSLNSRLEIQNTHVELGKLIEEILDQCTFIEKAKKLKKIVIINQKSKLVSDKDRLKLILNNLVANAIYYSNPYAEEPFLKIEAETDENITTIKVSDNGMGIGQEHLNKIFQMFYKANGSGKGFGLGLYIAKEAIDKLKGKIEVYSELGKGTEFTVRLPSFHPSMHFEDQG